jgi:hypothetical protein
VALVKSISFQELGWLRNWYVVELQVVKEPERLYGCSRLVIRGNYNFLRWWIINRSPTAPTWSGHQAAVKMLHDSNEPFLFGLIGQGLKATNQTCVFESEGLSIDYSNGEGRPYQIISFYMTS